MRKRTGWRVALAAAVGMSLVGRAQPAMAEEPTITVTPLLGPAGEPLEHARQINERGQVIGWVKRPNVGWFTFSAGVVWEDGVAREIVAPTYGPPGLEGQVWAVPLEISQRGQVMGIRMHVSGFASWPFAWDDGRYTALVPEVVDPTSVTSASDLNEWGQILGTRFSAGSDPFGPPILRPVVWRDGREVASVEEQAMAVDLNNTGTAAVNLFPDETFPIGGTAGVWSIGRGVTDLGTLGGAASRSAAINELGQVAGVSDTASGDEHAFLWQRGRMTDLGTLGGSWSRVITPDPGVPPVLGTDEMLNEWGHVVGVSQTATGEEHAFLWRHGRIIDLGTLGGPSSRPAAINEWGQVVGEAQTADGAWHAFLWDDGEMSDIGALASELDSRATDINNRGEIIGVAGGAGVLWTVHP